VGVVSAAENSSVYTSVTEPVVSNCVVTVKYHGLKRKGTFSLQITSVSEKDVGKYACKASVSEFGKANVDEDFIELSLYRKGEFHLLMLHLCKVILTYRNSLADGS